MSGMVIPMARDLLATAVGTMTSAEPSIVQLERRHLLNFNGTNWAQLQTPINFNGEDFEIEMVWAGINEGTQSAARFTFNSEESNFANKHLHIGRRNGEVFTFAFFSNDLNVDLAGVVDWQKINTFVCKYINNEMILEVNGVEKGRKTSIGIPNINASKTLIGRNSMNNTGTTGAHFRTRVWKNGDRNTGDLVLDTKLDDPTTDYQLNKATRQRDIALQYTVDADFSVISKKYSDNYWLMTGYLNKFEYHGIAGNHIDSLLNNSKYPDNYDYFQRINRLYTSSDVVSASYGQLIKGFINLKDTASYQLAVTSDNGSQVWLDNNLIAQVEDYVWRGNLEEHQDQKSAVIQLIAGINYPIEIRHKQGGGGHHCDVYISKNGGDFVLLAQSDMVDLYAKMEYAS